METDKVHDDAPVKSEVSEGMFLIIARRILCQWSSLI